MVYFQNRIALTVTLFVRNPKQISLLHLHENVTNGINKLIWNM